MRSIRVLLACSALCVSFAAAQSTPPPDDIYFNGRIYTGAGFDKDKPQVVEAIAISGGKVLAIGSNDEVKRLAGPKTHLHALDSTRTGVTIFPGINDAHTHLGSAGQTKLNVDLTGVKSLAEMLAVVQKFAQAAPAGHWLTGGNWDHTFWTPATLPTRQDLDKVTGNHPTWLVRIDGHIALANTAALKAAGITGKTAAPQGGAIDLDAAGAPTGILRESAQSLVEKITPPPTPAEHLRGDKLAIADALSHGVTSVQDFSDWEDFLTFEQLEKQGQLHLRIYEWLPFIAPLDKLKQMRAHHDANDPLLRTGMLKGFMDGSLGSRTAAMKQPFTDDPKNSGLPQFTQDQLNKMAVERAQAGFQLGFHAIGDKATSMALEAFSQPTDHCPDLRKEDKAKSKDVCFEPAAIGGRFRIEHAQVVDPADIPRFKQLGVIASMQPNHLLTDMNWAESRLGPQRAAYSYAWKAFLDAGVPLAFGTDYPVEPITPFRGLYAAVTRMNEAGTKIYFPENKLTRGQALYAYTQGSAYAEFAEKRKGKLLPGYDADLVVLDRDLYTCPAPAILKTRVLTTIVAGKQAYQAPAR
ncbi:amidohydrolase [Terracidiphilus sp.]|jgi:predicted amidohydrolase YtcJ|uniref:amidohydrolase n=1 Tax=Terracidiphilus sp. TaxID=1964191 RepID=UPI003C1A6C33